MNTTTQYMVTPSASEATPVSRPASTESVLAELADRFEFLSRQSSRPVFGGRELSSTEATAVAQAIRLAEDMQAMLIEVLPYMELAAQDPLYKRDRAKKVLGRLKNLIYRYECEFPA